MVAYAKPAPDLFLAAAERLGVPITDSVVVGDSVWDLLAARRGRDRARTGAAARGRVAGRPREVRGIPGRDRITSDKD
jgi:beta-phosphoglucomutase-like phosphatase (HAD superfamily)